MSNLQVYDLDLKINKTTIQIIEGDITNIEADAIVSSDDTYLSMSGGVSQSIRSKAGDLLIDDVRKQPLPLEIGDIAVTTAGRLPARYVLHATTLGFGKRLSNERLIFQLISKILDASNFLGIETVAVPLLGTGTGKLSKQLVLKLIVEAAMYRLASSKYKLKMFIVVLMNPGDMEKTFEEIKVLASKASEIQRVIEKIRDLEFELSDEDDLKPRLQKKVDAKFHELQNLLQTDDFDFVENDDHSSAEFENNPGAREQLLKAQKSLEEDLNKKMRLQEIDRANLKNLAKPASGEHDLEIKTIKERIEMREQEIERLYALQNKYQNELKSLEADFQAYLSTLLKLLTSRFDDSELKTLTFFLNLDYADLSGDRKSDKARELLIHLKRRDQLDNLVSAGQKLRPDITWPEPP